MEQRVIAKITEMEKILLEKKIARKYIDRMFACEYITYGKQITDIPLKMQEEKTNLLVTFAKKKDSVIVDKVILAIDEREKITDQDLFKLLLKAVSTNANFAKFSFKKKVMRSGFSVTSAYIADGQVKTYQDDMFTSINRGALDFLSKKLYQEVYKKPYLEESVFLPQEYIAQELFSLVNFVVYETEDISMLLKKYIRSDIESFLMDFKLVTRMEVEELVEVFNAAFAVTSGKEKFQDIYMQDNYAITVITRFIKDMQKIAKKHNVTHAEYVFSKLANKPFFSSLF